MVLLPYYVYQFIDNLRLSVRVFFLSSPGIGTDVNLTDIKITFEIEKSQAAEKQQNILKRVSHLVLKLKFFSCCFYLHQARFPFILIKKKLNPNNRELQMMQHIRSTEKFCPLRLQFQQVCEYSCAERLDSAQQTISDHIQIIGFLWEYVFEKNLIDRIII